MRQERAAIWKGRGLDCNRVRGQPGSPPHPHLTINLDSVHWSTHHPLPHPYKSVLLPQVPHSLHSLHFCFLFDDHVRSFILLPPLTYSPSLGAYPLGARPRLPPFAFALSLLAISPSCPSSSHSFCFSLTSPPLALSLTTAFFYLCCFFPTCTKIWFFSSSLV